MYRFSLVISILLVSSIAISQEKIYSDTLYFDEDKNPVRKGEHYVDIYIDSIPLILADGTEVYPFLAKKRPYKRYGEGYSFSFDSISSACLIKLYKREGKPRQILLQNYKKYLVDFPELNEYYKLLEPYINPIFCAVDSNFTLDIKFRRNNSLEYVAVYDADCGCIGTAYVSNRFNPHIFYIRDKNGSDRDGRDFTYEKKGRLVRQEFYKDDKRHGTWKDFDSEGRLKNLETYIEDKRNGKFIRYYKDGHIKEVTHFMKGKRHGGYKKYYHNGHLEVKGYYFEGKRRGEWFYFDGKGVLKTFRVFVSEENNEDDN